jgi:glycosyltransferase involved in cell wall biosynthesis
MQEMAEELRNRGHKIIVVTAYPQYNVTAELKGKSFDEFSDENGIAVVRIKTLPHHKVNFIIRGISQLTMPYIFLSKINRYLRDKIDASIVYSPPLTLAKVGMALKKKYGAKFILNIQDIFPQNAIDLGVLKSRFLINLFKWIEEKAYKSADKIAVHSDGNKKFLVDKKDVSSKKVYVLHNWIDLTTFKNQGRTGIYRKKYGIDNKFIFLFAGVVGPSQGLDLIINLANNVKNIQDICFLIVGDGMEKERLMKMAEDYSLKNIVFQPFVSKDEYPKLVKDSDVGMICLTSLNKTPVVPGKILGYMAASLPVVAFLNRESDGHKIIRDAQCGYSAISDNPDKATEVILKIYTERDRLNQYGKNGFNYVSNYFAKDVCVDQLEKLF